MEYFLLISGEKQGPFSGYEILTEIRDGKLKGEEMVWRKGLPEWRHLRSIDDFEDSWPTSPGVVAAAEEARKLARASLDTPQPWLRFWARFLDYFFFSTLIRFALFVIYPDGMRWLMHVEMEAAPVLPVFMLVFAPIEAWMLSRFGTTPGKSFLRVQVRRPDGALPTFHQAMTRSLLVFIKGMCLGFPFLALVTMTMARLRLLRRGISSWDEQTQLRVEHGEPEPWRYALVFLLVLLVIGAALVLVVLSPEWVKMIKEWQNLPK